MSPTENVSGVSMQVFQNRMLSGKPSRSRGPGNSSRKKSASLASNERKPFGTILIGWLSDVGVTAGFVAGMGVVGAGAFSGSIGLAADWLALPSADIIQWRRSSA